MIGNNTLAGGSSTLIGLADFPASYDGHAGEAVVVNAGENGVEFVPASGAGDMTKAVYDPTNINSNAFNTDNHTSGTTNKVYTATEQSKLSGIAAGAEVNVQSDWNQTTNTADDYIKNKPAEAPIDGFTYGRKNLTWVKDTLDISRFKSDIIYPAELIYSGITDVATEAQLVAAISAASNFNIINLTADITLTSTLVINKSLKFTGSFILQSAGGASDPVTLISITANDVCFDTGLTIKHLKTTNTSVEVAVNLNALRFISRAVIEFMEFGYILRGSWSITGTTTYTGALANNHRHFGIYSISEPSAIDSIIFNFPSEATPRDSFIYISTSLGSDKFNSTLKVSSCRQLDITKINRQFYLQDSWVSDGGAGLIIENCVFNSLNGDIGFLGSSGQNVLSFFTFVAILNNYSNNAATIADSYKGLLYLDGSGAVHNYGTTNFYYSGNIHSIILRSANDYISVIDYGGVAYKNTVYDNTVPLSVIINDTENNIYNWSNQLASSQSIQNILKGTYAGIYVSDGVTAQNIATGSTYVKLTGFETNGLSSNCTSDATNDKITFTKTGVYIVSWNISFTSNTNLVVWKITTFLNSVEQNSSHAQTKVGTGADSVACSGVGFIDVTTVPWDLDLRVRHDNGGTVAITPVYMNMTVNYVGNT